ncbi:CPBP family intramembrane glutamic endopeptidase [Salirhabdus salicampi]|uniref:CPBP family intramembrane glutamic endopeptidase n=1 Tax=Salirhabdus salicampi TaxID=476102 RepID=UPI0020C43431|nr:CPBP family intramembrane glutamic endopeptidase [Salirhabdus salicampi]MCP8617355.1 CPBP family intramembrane metalloprotease [Salirhabdus salicampi]
MNKKQITHIIIMSMVSCVTLFIVEQVIDFPYGLKTLCKIGLFLMIPVLYIRFVIKQPVRTFLNLRSFTWVRLKSGFFLGLLSIGIIYITYILLNDFINERSIIYDLENRLGINAKEFIFIGIYITLGNSFLEEFYFRGFIFLRIYQMKHKLLAYVYSALLFSLYHIAIFATWFNVWIMCIAVFGLFIVGLLFNWLNTRAKNFFNSWILHICADVAVVTIGFYLYYIY